MGSKSTMKASPFFKAQLARPLAVQPMVSLVQALMRAKETDKAVDFLKSTLEADPANAEARVLMGSI